MFHVRLSVFLVGLLVLTGGLAGQEKPEKKDDPKDAKKADTPTKVKGQLPQGWGKLGLSDDQKQKIYTIQAKYGEEIRMLEAQIKDLREKMRKEERAVLTPEQKKKLEEMAKSKAGG